MTFVLRSLAVAVVVVSALACGRSKQEAPGTHAVAEIVDLSTSVADLQRDFDAHAGEPRFVMLLSPT